MGRFLLYIGCVVFVVVAAATATVPGPPREVPRHLHTMARIVTPERPMARQRRHIRDALVQVEEEAGEGDFYCISSMNLPQSMTYCPHIDYSVAVPKEELAKTGAEWYTAAAEQGVYYYNADGAVRWDRPESETFARLERKAMEITKALTTDTKGCERSVRAAVCAVVFRRCESKPRDAESWSDADTTRVGIYDLAPLPVKRLYPVCKSFCDAASECIEPDADVSAHPVANALKQCDASVWRDGAEGECCCSHAWGLSWSHGGSYDGLQVAAFGADAISVHRALQYHLPSRKFVLGVREPRVFTMFMKNKYGDEAESPSIPTSTIDYTLSGVTASTIESVLGTNTKSMADECIVLKEKDASCAREVQAKGTVLKPELNPMSPNICMATPERGPTKLEAKAIPDAGDDSYCRNRVNNQKRFVNFMSVRANVNSRVGDKVCDIVKNKGGSLAGFRKFWFPEEGGRFLHPVQCSGREIVSGPEDTIFFYVSSHGHQDGALAMGADLSWSTANIRASILTLARRRRFKKMLVVVDACFSASIFDNWPEMPPRVYAITSAVSEFVSWMGDAQRCVQQAFADKNYECFEDGSLNSIMSSFSAAWLRDTLHRLSLGKDNEEATVERQCDFVKNKLVGGIASDFDFASYTGDLPRCIGVSDKATHSLYDFFRGDYNLLANAMSDEDYHAGVKNADEDFSRLENAAVDRRLDDVTAKVVREAKKALLEAVRVAKVPFEWPPAQFKMDGYELSPSVAIIARILLMKDYNCGDLLGGLSPSEFYDSLVDIDDLVYDAQLDGKNVGFNIDDPKQLRLAILHNILDAPGALMQKSLKEIAMSSRNADKLLKVITRRAQDWVHVYAEKGLLTAPEPIITPFSLLQYLVLYSSGTASTLSRPNIRPTMALENKCDPDRAESPAVLPLTQVMAAVLRRVGRCEGHRPTSKAHSARTEEIAATRGPANAARMLGYVTELNKGKGELLGEGMYEIYGTMFCHKDCEKFPAMNASCMKYIKPSK